MCGLYTHVCDGFFFSTVDKVYAFLHFVYTSYYNYTVHVRVLLWYSYTYMKCTDVGPDLVPMIQISLLIIVTANFIQCQFTLQTEQYNVHDTKTCQLKLLLSTLSLTVEFLLPLPHSHSQSYTSSIMQPPPPPPQPQPHPTPHPHSQLTCEGTGFSQQHSFFNAA